MPGWTPVDFDPPIRKLPQMSDLAAHPHLNSDTIDDKRSSPKSKDDAAVRNRKADVPLNGSSSIGVGTKIYGVVALCLLVMAVAVGIAFTQMSSIGTEIENIAERDIPVVNALTKISVHQLEQEISMEKAFRHGEAMETDPDATDLFGKAVEKFEILNGKIEKELKDATTLIAQARETAPGETGRAAFMAALDEIGAIGKSHNAFHAETVSIFDLIRAGNLTLAHTKEDQVEKAAVTLNQQLERLLVKFENLTEEAAKSAEEHEHAAIRLILIVGVVGLLGAALASFLLVRFNVVGPLNRVVGGLNALEKGDLDVEISVGSEDEIGKVARALQDFRETLIGTRKLEEQQKAAEQKAQEEERRRTEAEKEAAARKAEEDQRTAREVAARAEKLESIIGSFDQDVSSVLENVSSAATEMRSSAEAMAATAEQTSRQSSAVAAASEEAATNVQTVASAAEELSASVAEISRQVTESSRIAQSAVVDAGKTTEKVRNLAEAAQKIGDVVNLINHIASQTNLLALNATIEAARAGEAGKGFAVVASEVKSLATQTAKATDEISGQIGSIQGATGEAATAIGEISDVIGRMNDITAAIASAVEEQGASTKEIAGNVQQAATGTQDISSNITQVNQAASETGIAASQVLDAAGELARQGERLRQRVDTFLQEIRVA